MTTSVTVSTAVTSQVGQQQKVRLAQVDLGHQPPELQDALMMEQLSDMRSKQQTFLRACMTF